jgi:putative transposase
LATKAGDVELKIPKLRAGSFFPSILERRRRIDRALFAVVMEASVHGVSTARSTTSSRALGATSGISKSEVSRICRALDAEMTGFCARSLNHVEFPYVLLDATYLKGRVNGQVVSRAVVVATGVSMNGDREVLGCAVGHSEDEAFWSDFLRSQRSGGLHGVRLVISDHHLGLKKAITSVMIGAAWQRCRVHFMRNVLARVPRASSEMIAAAIRTIFAQPDGDAVAEQLERITVMLGREFPDVTKDARRRPRRPLGVRGVPTRTLAQDLVHESARAAAPRVKRRCDVVGVFPHDAAVDRLVTAVIVEAHDECQVTDRRDLSETAMAGLRQTEPTTVPASTRARRRLAG